MNTHGMSKQCLESESEITDPILLFAKKPWTSHTVSTSPKFLHQQNEDNSIHIKSTVGRCHFYRSDTIDYQQFHMLQHNSDTSGLKGSPKEVMDVRVIYKL